MQLILEKDYSSRIKNMFPTDKDLIEKYHVESGNGAEACVQRTIDDISKFDKSFQFYVIKDQDKEIGFFGKEYDFYLNTIFVLPEYRTKEKMSEIWDLIKSKYSGKIMTALYSKNSRAINFYLRNGGNIVKEFMYNNNPVTLINLGDN